MPLPSTRAAHDLYDQFAHTQSPAAKRTARKTAKDRLERLPNTREIDAALAHAFAQYVGEKYGGDLSAAGRDRSELMKIVKRLLARLEHLGYDLEHPSFRSRVFRRLGDDAWDAPPRGPGGM